MGAVTLLKPQLPTFSVLSELPGQPIPSTLSSTMVKLIWPGNDSYFQGSVGVGYQGPLLPGPVGSQLHAWMLFLQVCGL